MYSFIDTWVQSATADIKAMSESKIADIKDKLKSNVWKADSSLSERNGRLLSEIITGQ